MNIRFFLVSILILAFESSIAHPGDGLIVKDDGWYFVAMEPIEGPRHHAALWRWSRSRGLALVYRVSHHSSNLHVKLGLDGQIYCAERHFLGERSAQPGDKPGERDVFSTRLGLLVGHEIEWLTGAESGRRPFGGNAFIIDAQSTIYFADAVGGIQKRNSAGRVEPLEITHRFDDLGNMAWGPDGEIFVLDGMIVKKISKDRTVTSLVTIPKVKESSAHALDGTIIFDMVVDTSNNVYLADWGQMQVLKVNTKGEVTQFHQSRDDYGPEGLALLHDKVAVFESTHPRSHAMILPRLLSLDAA